MLHPNKQLTVSHDRTPTQLRTPATYGSTFSKTRLLLPRPLNVVPTGIRYASNLMNINGDTCWTGSAEIHKQLMDGYELLLD
jgi:hypothetical protein